MAASLHHGDVDTAYEELVRALEPRASQYCTPASNDSELQAYANLALFSTVLTFVLFGALKYCHY